MKITKKKLLERIELIESWMDGADEMLTELNHALPDPEYDAKCEAAVAGVEASLDRHRERLGLNKPQLKQLDQSVFDGLDEKWRFAAVDSDGSARAYNYNQVPIGGNHEPHPDQSEKGFEVYEFIGTGYDASNWQNSLIERDVAKELLEVDLSSELTGSDYYYSKSVTERLENGQKLVMCFVSNVSESDAMNESHVEVITSVDTELNDTDGYGWQYAIPINNQGEPLTAAEVGL